MAVAVALLPCCRCSKCAAQCTKHAGFEAAIPTWLGSGLEIQLIVPEGDPVMLGMACCCCF
jgi:hypothetical protein